MIVDMSTGRSNFSVTPQKPGSAQVDWISSRSCSACLAYRHDCSPFLGLANDDVHRLGNMIGVVGVWVRLFYADPPAPVFTLRRHRDTPTRLPRVVERVLTERAKHGVGWFEGE